MSKRIIQLILGLAVISPAVAQVIPQPAETVAITAAPPYSVSGLLYITKADTNAPGLHNPVLVVEGFDIDNSMDWPELYELLNQETLVEELQAYGRDLVILNFDDSTADILANSVLTETAINYVNANRSDPSDKFTAVGASLGGLTVRKALVDMPAHDVDTWISFDAPHEGANMPLGVQEFFEHFSTVGLDDFDAIREFLLLLDAPAAKQLMLIHHSHTDGLAGDTTNRQTFMGTMDAAGYPTNCKTIAISNGSGYGEKLPFNPGDLIIHWYHDGPFFIGPDIKGDMHALPQSTNTATTVYDGKFTSLLGSASPNSKTVSSYHPLPFDNAPGGYRPTFYQIFTNLPPGYINGDDYCTQTNHCFIPTVSALGIPIGNLESNLASHAELTALSPFDEIHYAINNEPHVEINAHNKRWIMRAVLEDRDTDGDGYDDYQEYLLGTAYDSANSLLDVYAIIEVFLVDSEAQLTWNAYPNTQYEVWFAAELGELWQLLETILPTLDPDITRTYLIDTAEPSGFFKIIATPVDPVTD